MVKYAQFKYNQNISVNLIKMYATIKVIKTDSRVISKPAKHIRSMVYK